MNVKVTEHFNKDIAKLRDKKVILAAKVILQKIETCNSLYEIPSLKKMEGTQKYFRIRVGDYRMGIFFDNKIIYITRFLHRKEIYRYFP
jgi:mRNA interferase RelE/StbE